jgi:hypothetical protein
MSSKGDKVSEELVCSKVLRYWTRMINFGNE